MIIATLLTALCLANGEGSLQYQNPVVNADHPDPGALALPGGAGYVLVSTSQGNADAFPILTSGDLVTWSQEGFVFPAGAWPFWALPGYFWAPEIHFFNGQFHVYFSANSSTNNRFCIGVARSLSPLGPFLDLGRPLIEDPEIGVIDVHWFRDPVSSRPYIIWKKDWNAIGEPAAIFIREVAEDGATFPAGTNTTRILTADRPVERGVVEGPWIHYRKPFYYLFYSGDGYRDPLYFTGVARSLSVCGPYEKQSNSSDPFLHTDLEAFDGGRNTSLVGPGHGSLVSVGGQDWFLYHAWRWDRVGQAPGRTLCLDPVAWSGAGWPHIGVPSTGARPGPGGRGDSGPAREQAGAVGSLMDQIVIEVV